MRRVKIRRSQGLTEIYGSSGSSERRREVVVWAARDLEFQQDPIVIVTKSGRVTNVTRFALR